MAGYLNKVMLIGRLGRDPEARYTDNQTPISKFTMATSEYRNDPSGGRTERTEWHSITAFGRLADVCNRYLRKGMLVYVEGKIRTNQYTDRNGQDRRFTEIVCDSMQMLESRGQNPDRGSDRGYYADGDAGGSFGGGRGGYGGGRDYGSSGSWSSGRRGDGYSRDDYRGSARGDYGDSYGSRSGSPSRSGYAERKDDYGQGDDEFEDAGRSPYGSRPGSDDDETSNTERNYARNMGRSRAEDDVDASPADEEISNSDQFDESIPRVGNAHVDDDNGGDIDLLAGDEPEATEGGAERREGDPDL